MSFPVQELTIYTLPQPIDSMKTLYARHFYPALLREVRAAKKVVLIGNAGTATSTIQFYVLKVLLDAHDGLTTLPPDCWGSTMPFDVVVREVADAHTEVYFLKEAKAHQLSKDSTEDVLQCFDPKTTLYMYEPLLDRVSAPCWVDHPSLATVSPEPRRYKEYRKQGGKARYMPVWTEPQLLAMARHMRDTNTVPKGMEALYSDASVRERFSEFGGILRSVLPESDNSLHWQRVGQMKALDNLSDVVLHRYLTAVDVDNQVISTFLAYFDVDMDSGFRFYHVKVLGGKMHEKMLERVNRLTYEETVRILLNADQQKVSTADLGLAFERYMACQFGKSFTWKLRRVDATPSATPNDASPAGASRVLSWTSVALQLTVPNQLCAGTELKKMQKLTLYKPQQSNFPAVDMYFMLNDKTVVGVQVSRTTKATRKVWIGALRMWLLNLAGVKESESTRTEQKSAIENLLNSVQLQLWYAPLPTKANTASIKFDTKSIQVKEEDASPTEAAANADKAKADKAEAAREAKEFDKWLLHLIEGRIGCYVMRVPKAYTKYDDDEVDEGEGNLLEGGSDGGADSK